MSIGLIGLFLAGCGDDAEDFVGTWNWDSGSNRVLNCNGGSNTESLTGNENLIAGSEVDLVFSVDECNWNFDVNGDTANLISGQSCEYSVSDGAGGTFTVTENWSTITLNLSNSTMTVSGNGTLELSGSSVDCATSINGTLSRVGG